MIQRSYLARIKMVELNDSKVRKQRRKEKVLKTEE